MPSTIIKTCLFAITHCMDYFIHFLFYLELFTDYLSQHTPAVFSSPSSSDHLLPRALHHPAHYAVAFSLKPLPPPSGFIRAQEKDAAAQKANKQGNQPCGKRWNPMPNQKRKGGTGRTAKNWAQLALALMEFNFSINGGN